MMRSSDIIFPAEWELGGVVMVAWPHKDTDWTDMLDEVDECYCDLTAALADDGKVVILTPEPERVEALTTHIDRLRLLIVKLPTDDTWTRDYGPLTVKVSEEMRLRDFMFNGWGLKFAAANDNLANSRLSALGVLRAPLDNLRATVLEGGSVESDGQGTILTTSRCLLSPNRNAELSRHGVELMLRRTLGARRVLWLDHGALEGDDTDSHIDTLARMAPYNTIVYVGCDNPADSHYAELKLMEEQLRQMRTVSGSAYNLIALPLPDAVYGPDGERLPATYANYLATPTAVFMPVYGQPRNDRLATEMIKIVYPNHKIYTVNCLPLVRQHGSLHCATMQLHPDAICI